MAASDYEKPELNNLGAKKGELPDGALGGVSGGTGVRDCQTGETAGSCQQGPNPAFCCANGTVLFESGCSGGYANTEKCAFGSSAKNSCDDGGYFS